MADAEQQLRCREVATTDDGTIDRALAMITAYGTARFASADAYRASRRGAIAAALHIVESGDDVVVGAAISTIMSELGTDSVQLNFHVVDDRLDAARQLLVDVRGWADVRGATRLVDHCSSANAWERRMFEQLGFTHVGDRIELRGDVHELHVEPTRDDVAIVTLDERPDLEASVDHVLRSSYADIPFVVPPAEAEAAVPGLRDMLSGPPRGPLPAPVHVALVDGDVVAMGVLVGQPGDPSVMSHRMTGVLREHRGCGLARAIKSAQVVWARVNGVATLLTTNDPENVAMLRVNRRLGYREFQRRSMFVRDV